MDFLTSDPVVSGELDWDSMVMVGTTAGSSDGMGLKLLTAATELSWTASAELFIKERVLDENATGLLEHGGICRGDKAVCKRSVAIKCVCVCVLVYTCTWCV